jgi:F-type H+-transporting ATPase subunit b
MWIRIATIIAINCCVCGSAWASSAEEIAMKKGIFSGSFADALWTLLSFGILVAALGKLAWRPLLNGLKAREDHIRIEIETAEKTRKEAQQTLEDYNKRVAELEQKRRQITEEITSQAHKQGREIAEKARQEALAIKQKAQSDIEAAQLAAKAQLWDEAGEIVLTLGGKILGRTITDEDNWRFIREMVSKLQKDQTAEGG